MLYSFLFRTFSDTGRGYGGMLMDAGESAFDGDCTFNNKLIAQYHSEVHDTDKTRILTEFRKPTSIIICIISTVAFGLGVDPFLGLLRVAIIDSQHSPRCGVLRNRLQVFVNTRTRGHRIFDQRHHHSISVQHPTYQSRSTICVSRYPSPWP